MFIVIREDTLGEKHRRYDVGEWQSKSEKSWWAWIYVAGDIKIVEEACRKLCFPQGLCVTVEEVNYIFGGGTELGVRIGMIQYPPFPESEKDLMEKAIKVGKLVAEANYQWSFSIVTAQSVSTYSRRA